MSGIIGGVDIQDDHLGVGGELGDPAHVFERRDISALWMASLLRLFQLLRVPEDLGIVGP